MTILAVDPSNIFLIAGISEVNISEGLEINSTKFVNRGHFNLYGG
jgi:hypothetical protein